MRKALPSPKPRNPAPVNGALPEGIAAIHPGNVELGYDAKSNRLVVFIDCSGRAVEGASASASGKSRVLATTTGFAPVPLSDPILSGLKLSLTATLPPVS